jgi:hypothetical protein
LHRLSWEGAASYRNGMPSKKQRRRRQKSLRHEYEYVLVDEEGNELPVEPTELKKKETAAKPRSGARPARATRTVQPPSWQRVGKRGLIFAPVMFIMVTILSGAKLSMAGKITQTLMLLAFFLPFSYLMDTFAYRTYKKRLDRSGST